MIRRICGEKNDEDGCGGEEGNEDRSGGGRTV